jgi:asparagine synthetase B (glutamine-hydrolysing)
MGLRLLLSDPEVHSLETPQAFWAIFGGGPRLPDGFEQRLSNDEMAAQKLCADIGDATVLKIQLDDGRPVQATVWRGLSSGYEVYYTARPNGDVLIADHFRNLLALLPVSERSVTDGATVDHFLFRAVPGAESYCKDVFRAAHGERLTLNLDTGHTRTDQFDRIDVDCEKASVEEYEDWADTALHSVIDPLSGEPGVTNLFSGGVDSTLIHTYLGKNVPALTVVRTDNTESFEAQYAAHSADLLGVDLDRRLFDPSSFLDVLAGNVAHVGMPPLFFQSGFYRAVWEAPQRKLITGLHADTLYGFGALSARLASPFASALGNLILGAAAPILNSSPRLNAIRPAAAQLRCDPTDPFGYAGLTATRGDVGTISRALGSDLVEARLERRLAYALARSPQPNPSISRFYQHLELAHWCGNFGEDDLGRMRHAAVARGKALAGPFYSKALLTAATRVPAKDRYLKRLDSKYILKGLLKRRLPAYPINQRKGQSTIPFEPFYRSGPLSQVWERYEMPSWFRETGPDGNTQIAPGAAQSAVLWAIWHKEVMENPNLRTIPGVQVFEWGAEGKPENLTP